MKIFPVGASLVGALALSLVACGDDSSSNVSENRPSSYENTSSSSGDTIAYATPPTLSCENVSFLPVYRGEEGTVLDSSYSVKQIIFRENGDVVLLEMFKITNRLRGSAFGPMNITLATIIIQMSLHSCITVYAQKGKLPLCNAGAPMGCIKYA